MRHQLGHLIFFGTGVPGIWSATSEVTDPSSVAKATEELAKVLIAKMKADGVI